MNGIACKATAPRPNTSAVSLLAMDTCQQAAMNALQLLQPPLQSKRSVPAAEAGSVLEAARGLMTTLRRLAIPETDLLVNRVAEVDYRLLKAFLLRQKS